ncbi:MAG: hypothetical protein AAGC60_11685 [Acidobacteriota bacterium]
MSIPRIPVGLACGATLLYLGAALYVLGAPGFPLDDAWIHLRFARALALGDGLTYDPAGAVWVGGSTAPLWTALLALGFVLPGRPVLVVSLLLGLVSFLALVVAVDRFARALGLSAGWAGVAAGLVAGCHWLVWSALSGMEIALFTALAVAGLAAHAQERRGDHVPRAPALLALSCLARPEGVLPLMAVLADRWIELHAGRPRPRRDPRALVAAGSALALGLPTLLVYRLLGGSWLPTTFAAKTGDGFDLVPSLGYLQLVGGLLLGAAPLLAPLALVGLGRLVRLPQGRPLAAWLLGQPLAYALLATPGAPPPMGNFGRYHFPLLPLLLLAAVVGLERLLRGARRPVVLAVVGLVALPQAALLAVGPPRYTQTVANVQDSDVRAACWLRENLPPEAVLGVQDIGAVGYFAPHRLVDLAGIVTPEVVPVLLGTDPEAPADGATNERYWEERLVDFLAEREVDYLVVFAESYPALAASPSFRRIARFDVEDNVTMAGSTLLVLATPWSRHPPHASPSANPRPANPQPANTQPANTQPANTQPANTQRPDAR